MWCVGKQKRAVKHTPGEYYVKKETIQFANHHIGQTYLVYSIYSTSPREISQRAKAEPGYKAHLVASTSLATFTGGLLAANGILAGIHPALAAPLSAVVVAALLYLVIAVDNREERDKPAFQLKEQEPAEQLANLLNLKLTQKLSKKQKAALKQLRKTAEINMGHQQ